MNDNDTTMPAITASDDLGATPAGFQRHTVIWPTTQERISVLMPVPSGQFED